MILIGLGANLPSRFGTPVETLHAACAAMAPHGIEILNRSPIYRTAPVPVSDQPDYYNAVIAVKTTHTPAALLAALHTIEAEFGRVRSVTNAPRLLDLDLLAYDDAIMDGNLVIPHPRLHERAFVLYPLRDVAPEWRHPITNLNVNDMVVRIPEEQHIKNGFVFIGGI